MKNPKNHPAKIIVPLITIGILMALLLILIPRKPELKPDQIITSSDNRLILEAISEEMVMGEETWDMLNAEESEESDTEGMLMMLEELEFAK